MSKIPTLKVRAEFLAVRGGVRASVPSCLIEARKRRPAAADAPQIAGPRFGLTVTKKLGNAVTRNRIRRRLKAAISELAPSLARAGYDYVVVARAAAFDRPFADIRADIAKALTQLHRDNTPRSAADSQKPRKNPLA